MKLYAGIDGGQSSTVAVIGDDDGRVLARGHAGPADEVGQDAHSTRLHDALSHALADASARAGLRATTRFACIAAGISGYEGRVYGRAPELPADSMLLMHDAPIAHAGALTGQPGAIVIAGTGSVGYGVNEHNDAHMIGGWGYLFGDEGSAFWLARRVFEDAMREGVSAQGSELVATLLQRLEQPSLRAFARAFYSGAITRHMLAACAPEIFRAAENGDLRAADYREACVTALVSLAIATSETLGMTQPPVAFTGGLVRDTGLLAAVRTSLAERYPRSCWIEPQYDPAVGALILAYRAAGLAHECITEAA